MSQYGERREGFPVIDTRRARTSEALICVRLLPGSGSAIAILMAGSKER